ncbi:MAG: hypothetical protein EP346_08660 [Bacteroidetes bacterium]|nr:MAG: hypothetical protein EP346_08660 [Bacteroidota bacterium]
MNPHRISKALLILAIVVYTSRIADPLSELTRLFIGDTRILWNAIPILCMITLLYEYSFRLKVFTTFVLAVPIYTSFEYATEIKTTSIISTLTQLGGTQAIIALLAVWIYRDSGSSKSIYWNTTSIAVFAAHLAFIYFWIDVLSARLHYTEFTFWPIYAIPLLFYLVLNSKRIGRKWMYAGLILSAFLLALSPLIVNTTFFSDQHNATIESPGLILSFFIFPVSLGYLAIIWIEVILLALTFLNLHLWCEKHRLNLE